MQFSFWEKETFIKSPDVIIIGSGIVGLFTSIFLKRKAPKMHVLVLERGMLPYGASTRNAGFACYGSASELLDDLSKNSADEVFALVEKRWNGLRLLRETLGDQAIGYEPFGGHEVFTASDRILFEQCADFIPELNRQLHAITGNAAMYEVADHLAGKNGLGNIEHIIFNKGEGQVDTGKMMKSLLELARLEGVEILHGASVSEIIDGEEYSEVLLDDPLRPGEIKQGIKSNYAVICTNAFAGKFLPGFDIRPARAQVLVTSPLPEQKLKGSFHYDKGYYYFRNAGNRVLFGGGRNLDFEEEYTAEFGLTQKIQSRLDELLQQLILPGKQYRVDMRWSGIMGLGEEKKPIIKKTGERVYCAVRMGGMGVAIGSLTGMEAADLVLAHSS